MVILRVVHFLNFLDKMSIDKLMRSSTLALFMHLAAARQQKCENHCEYTFDHSEQLLFAFPPPHYALFKRYYVRTNVYVRHARV